MKRTISRGKWFPGFLKAIRKKDRRVEETINTKLSELAQAQRRPTDRLQNVGGLPIYKERFLVGNRMSGRLIVFVNEMCVVALAAYIKSKKTNMTADEILRLIDWEEEPQN